MFVMNCSEMNLTNAAHQTRAKKVVVQIFFTVFQNTNVNLTLKGHCNDSCGLGPIWVWDHCCKKIMVQLPVRRKVNNKIHTFQPVPCFFFFQNVELFLVTNNSIYFSSFNRKEKWTHEHVGLLCLLPTAVLPTPWPTFQTTVSTQYKIYKIIKPHLIY